jgi:hypothetical protein
VIATTRNRERFSMLEKLGAERCEIERRDLSKQITEAKKIDAILDLVGNSVVLDSLQILHSELPASRCRTYLFKRSPKTPRPDGLRSSRQRSLASTRYARLIASWRPIRL